MAETSGSKIGNNFQHFFAEAKEYLNLQGDYIRVLSVEKMTKIISMLLFVFAALLLVSALLFYLFFTLAYILAPFVGGLVCSFAIISALYLLLLVLLTLLRKALIVKPVLNMLASLLIEDIRNKKYPKDGVNNVSDTSKKGVDNEDSTQQKQ
ncbi:MAG: phage holin family protein [Paludibacteraceae bacterium]